jgi:phospholipase/carboxylesterase/glyoxalase family protein
VADLSFIHRYLPPPAPDAPTVLALHGTGGNEHDLVPLAQDLLPGAGVLSPRGQVLERGMPRFFRRLSEGVFDIDDLKRRTIDLADFVAEASAHYHFDPRRTIALGFSNGANVAASLLLMRPGVLGGAVLLRAMVPFVPDEPPSLDGTPILMLEGRVDPLVSAAEAERLASILRSGGARLTLEWQPSGHDLTSADVASAKAWLARLETPAGESIRVRHVV